MAALTRRRLLSWLPAVGAGALVLREAGSESYAGPAARADEGHPGGHAGDGHASFRGSVDHARNGFSPHEILRDFDWGKTTRLPGGQVLREWELVAGDKEIEVAPGVTYAAWTYNGRLPGPTLRAREGDRLRIRFANGSEHPHTIHFHGTHPAAMDGVPGLGAGTIEPGRSTVYEFEAKPFGMHLYHCHVRPLAEHLAKGLYGAFIVDPKEGREDADELMMMMHGLDTNFDGENEVYAVNGIGFAYMEQMVRVRRGELVRVYLGNMTEFDPVNSFHLHGNLFDYIPTGTSLRPAEHTDTVMLCQGQRGILEWRFPETGKFMFHAHQSEFTELGWMGFFEVVD